MPGESCYEFQINNCFEIWVNHFMVSVWIKKKNLTLKHARNIKEENVFRNLSKESKRYFGKILISAK